MSSGIVEEDKNSSQNATVEAQAAATGAPSPGANRSQLIQRLLDSSSNLPAFVNDLVTTQAVTVAGTEAAGFLIEKGEPGAVNLRPIAHIRPDNSSAETRAAAISAFQDLIRPCIQQGRDGAIEVSQAADGAEAQFCLVTLLRNEGDIVAASAVVTRCMNVERARQRLMSMQLVAGYFELFTLRRNADHARTIAQSHQHVLQLATSVATAEGFDAAGMSLCNELATRAHATRVSLGWLKGRNIKVKAISHTEEFDKKQELVVQLQRVMEECLDQEEVVQFDANGKGTDNVTRSAQQLSRAQGGHIVLSLPLRRRAEIIGVITAEFLPNTKIGPQVAQGLAIAVDLLAPQLFDRYTNDRWLITKAGISTRETAKKVIGPKHMLAKLIAVAVIGAIVFVTVYKPMYHVASQFQFVPITKNAISAPYEGFIEQLTTVDDGAGGTRKIMEGDTVKQGQVLMQLRTTDLQRKLADALAQESGHMIEAQKYRAERKPDSGANTQIALEQAAQARAQARLYQLQIDQATIKATMDGQLLTGDWESKIGAPVKQGDPLFEIGQPNALRVELAVSERDIQEIKPGQTGTIATHSLPDKKYPIVVERIEPMSGDAKDGENKFKVYAALKDTQKSWRPGMEGEAKVDIDNRPVWWIYSHRLIDFVKVKAWTWGF